MIECTNYRAHTAGALQGFADFYVPKWGLEIKGCSVFMKDGRSWINLPSKEYTKATGEKGFQPLVTFREKAHMDSFTKHAKEGIDKWIKANVGGAQVDQGREEPQDIKEKSFNDEDLPW